MTYTILVEVVNGPVTNAIVTDTLPVGQEFVVGSASPSQPIVSDGGRTLTWNLGTLNNGDPAVTITYDVKIDADASTEPQTNVAEICVSELPLCDTDDETVTPETPEIEIVKTAGTAEDGEVYTTEPGNVVYTYVVTNTGPLPLQNVTVTDDNGTPVLGDDFAVTCPKTTLAVDESMTCTATILVSADKTNVATARGFTAEGNPVEDDDDAVVEILTHGLVIAKSNNAPIETVELPDGSTADLPTADEGSTVTFTLNYTFSGDPVTNGVITDVLPIGLTYVAGSATDRRRVHASWRTTATTRTLTWTAATVTANGTLTYKAKVDVGAAELEQPLTNVATIDSDQTQPDDDTSDVFVPVIPAGETDVPSAPPTDTLEPAETSHGQQPAAHPGSPRDHPPGRRLRDAGPGTGQAPEPPLGTFAQPIVRSLRGSAVGWFVSPSPFMRRDPERRPIEALHHPWWGASVVLARAASARDRGLEARIDQLDGSVEASPDALDRGVAVEAHLEVGEQDAAGPDTGRQVADGRAVQVLGAGHDRAGPERDLAQERVAGAGQDVEVLGTSAVTRIDEAGTGRSPVAAASETRNPKLDDVWVTRAAWISKAATRRVPSLRASTSRDAALNPGSSWSASRRSSRPAGPITRTRRRGFSQRR